MIYGMAGSSGENIEFVPCVFFFSFSPMASRLLHSQNLDQHGDAHCHKRMSLPIDLTSVLRGWMRHGYLLS
jgi:hypothetical protein